MPHYLLQAGNTPALTLYEAKAMIGKTVELVGTTAVSFAADTDQAARDVFRFLGASVRLVRVEREWEKYSTAELEKTLGALLLQEKPSKLRFSVAQWGDRQTARLELFAFKEMLEAAGVKSRFIEGPREGLSAAVLLHQKVRELIVFERERKILIGTTLAVQDIDHWTVKDRRKPYSDRKKGMLPPKLARTMVNLALGPTVKPETLVYDPFCGTGTVLIEALERGAMVVGSDADESAVIGTKTNLAWFADRQGVQPDFTVFHSDVAHVLPVHVPGKIDALVTEPFLGKQSPKPAQLPGMFRGLEKLYLGAFHQWTEILHDGATIVIVFPRVELPDGSVFDLSGLIDKLQSRGYTLQVDFEALRYHRQDAIVQRQIVVFQYSPSTKKS